MIKVHRQIFEATRGDGPAVMLDTTFGFQLNADHLVRKTIGYFADAVGTRVEAARWRRGDAPVADAERTLELLSRASWVFAGPGSPTYALRQWTGTGIPGALTDLLGRGGTLVVGSAAACTLGTHAVPVYEIYKVGADPHWVPGLDLFGHVTGIKAALVPHFDNTEGGTAYDSRFCYLGEPRLAALEDELPEEIGVLGIDEHTALLIELTDRTVKVAGNGHLSVRRRGRTQRFGAGSELSLGELGSLLRGEATAASPGRASTPDGGTSAGAGTSGDTSADAAASADGGGPGALPSLGAETTALRAAFDTAVAARDTDGCVAAVLGLESAIVAWSADTDENDDADRAHRALRAMIVRLGELAAIGARDPRDVLRPYVELALRLRTRAREGRDFATSDLVRDHLATAGVDVRDTPDGVEWSLRES